MATGVDAKLLKSTKFPPEFSQKVDMTKVNLQVMKKWIAGKISEILGSEDDVVIELCFNLIEGSRYPDIKSLQIQLTGFLDKDTAPFCKELWNLCLSAQTSPQGVPKELLEAKKLELIQEKASNPDQRPIIEADKAAEEARKRREELESRRGQGGGRTDSYRGGRGGRGDRDTYRGGGRGFGRGRSPSRSPPPPRRGRDNYRGPARGRDSYVPGDRRPPRRRSSPARSPSADSASQVSVSTPPREQLQASQALALFWQGLASAKETALFDLSEPLTG
ncbi:hypothetical protein SLS53_003189 [Cytospora paraplurivora]|uniref:PWI domain-containing protein n=1 Tax=Cytospora paraplurivora TaxID=2898453 RepID=A0AAN9UBP8_9PEZI